MISFKDRRMIMRITYDEKTKIGLMNLMLEKSKSTVRLKVDRVGCGKPAIGLYAEDKRDGDTIIENNGVNFIVTENDKRYINDIEIKYNPEVYNNGFYVRVD